MRFKDVFKDLKYLSIEGDICRDIRGIEFDSRKVLVDYIFVALRGVSVDGHDYIKDSINNGCAVVVCECLPNEESLKDDVVYVIVDDTSIALAKIASNYYGNPSDKIKLIGITGTNGKTTIATLLYRLFKENGSKCGLLSTVVNYINDEEIKATHTTPDVLQINRLLREMLDKGCEYCFMEVSSHAISQNRVANLCFNGAVFTNITHDHLDYHKTFAKYLKVKKKFFDDLSSNSFALTNMDDKNGCVMLQNTKAIKKTYSIRAFADFKAKILEKHFSGMLLNINNIDVWTSLIGDYNVSNLLAVYATSLLLGMERQTSLRLISNLKSVAGRLDTVLSSNGIMGIVDYAHTPDAVKNVLENIVGLKKENQSVITVIGAGGDRDKTKRPEMSDMACRYSDKIILTSDNPRSEDPAVIIEDMKEGLNEEYLSKTLSIVDRKEAIRTAVMLAKSGDIILVAGKGHENYQETKGVRSHFDDKEVLNEIFNN